MISFCHVFGIIED